MNIQIKRKELWFPFLILFVQIILVAATTGQWLFGSNGDWMTQHIAIPDYLRNLFYDTGNPVPDYAFGLGAGQNIFNLSYYGLMSPVILLSYLLPFIKMATYVQIASVVLYFLTGFLAYRWLRKHFEETIALTSSLALIFSPALLFHSHHHIMFVWYMPFLLLALIGVDKLVDHGNSLLLSVCVCLIILTSYLFSPCAMVGLYIYYLYRITGSGQFRFRQILTGLIPIFIGIMMSALLLVPTALVIIGGRGSDTAGASFTLKNYLLPEVSTLLYGSYTPGLTCSLVLAMFSPLFTKKKQNWVFALFLLVVTLSPIAVLIFNGGMYIRGKALIPLIPLYCLSLSMMLKRLKDGTFKLIHTTLAMLVCILYCVFVRNYTTNLFFYIDCGIMLAALTVYGFYKKASLVAIPTLVLLCMTTISSQLAEQYADPDTLQALDKSNEMVMELAEDIQEKDVDFYRSMSLIRRHPNVNKTFGDNWYGTTLYSSTANSYYLHFYNFISGNNIQHRNDYLNVSTDNTLFASLMGVKYVISQQKDEGLYYDLIREQNGYYVFENKLSLPIVYTSGQWTDERDFLSQSYPYTLNTLFSSIVVKNHLSTQEKHAGTLQEITVSALKERYAFQVKDSSQSYTIPLDEPVEGKFLLITLTIDYNPNYDINIAINGVNNRLTARKWLYHNHNNTFEYTISAKEPISELTVAFTKGYYAFSDIHVFTLDISPENIPFAGVNVTELNKKNSTLVGTVSVSEDGYLATSFPYDQGFRIYIDGKETPITCVNTSFLGCAINKGDHTITITYHSPGFALGKLISLLGVLALICTTIYAYLKQKKQLPIQSKELVNTENSEEL